MDNVFNLSEIATKVHSILTMNPESRDDDRFLMALVWAQEFNDDCFQYDDFLRSFMEGKLSHPESITRSRRKLQEKYPNLRGERWDIRHGLESVMVNELNSI